MKLLSIIYFAVAVKICPILLRHYWRRKLRVTIVRSHLRLGAVGFDCEGMQKTVPNKFQSSWVELERQYWLIVLVHQALSHFVVLDRPEALQVLFLRQYVSIIILVPYSGSTLLWHAQNSIHATSHCMMTSTMFSTSHVIFIQSYLQWLHVSSWPFQPPCYTVDQKRQCFAHNLIQLR